LLALDEGLPPGEKVIDPGDRGDEVADLVERGDAGGELTDVGDEKS
jgi:hypothetical protein